ncbi:MAG TPA: DNA polymerase III subunit delta [Saprospiraceae bacterium]|nr:DNA polymerase III subunit delta [Saprospiraceae bacterium]
MDYQAILKDFVSTKVKPVYFLTGDEDYFIDSLVKEAESHLVPEAQRDFNLQVVYGKDTTTRALVEYCRQFPFMGDKKLVVVKEAQDLKDWDVLETYFKQPVPTTTLVIAFKNKKPDGRSAWVKTLKEKHVFFESKGIYDSQLPAFISNLASGLKLKMDQEASMLVAEYIGNDLSQINNELQKLRVNLEDGSKVNKDMVSEHIGISKEYNVFELCKAFSLKDKKRIYLITKNLVLHIKTNPLIPCITSMFNHFSKIWLTKHYMSKSDQELMALLKLSFISYIKEYKEAAAKYSITELEQIFSVLKEFDLKSKGVDVASVSQEDLLLELVLRISPQ